MRGTRRGQYTLDSASELRHPGRHVFGVADTSGAVQDRQRADEVTNPLALRAGAQERLPCLPHLALRDRDPPPRLQQIDAHEVRGPYAQTLEGPHRLLRLGGSAGHRQRLRLINQAEGDELRTTELSIDRDSIPGEPDRLVDVSAVRDGLGPLPAEDRLRL